tara:strand:- start:88 stop:261 length:174 start_codon:yes stop_codon:yes gene_type:complete
MITIETHPNLSNWINVNFLDKRIAQLTSRAKALRLAKSVAKKEKTFILDLDSNTEVK